MQFLTPLDRLALASTDIEHHAAALLNASNHESPIVWSAIGFYDDFCPASLGVNAPCANSPPPFNINISTIMFPDGGISTFDSTLPGSPSASNQSHIPGEIFTPFANFIQTIIAGVRIDLGNPSHNNFLLNSSVLNTTIFDSFPTTPLLNASASELYEANVHPDSHEMQGMLPLHVEGPASIQAAYPCQLLQIKDPGKLFISVLVATLSMFSGGWALFMLLASYWTKRNKEGEIIKVSGAFVDRCRVFQQTLVIYIGN